MQYLEENAIEYSFQNKNDPNESLEWDDIKPERVGNIIHGYLKEWKNSKELSPESHQSYLRAHQILSDLDLEATKTRPRPVPEEEVIREDTVLGLCSSL